MKDASEQVIERVEQAIRRSKGSLRLWLVFETADEAEAAGMLLGKRKVRHIEALSRQEWHQREEAALSRIAGKAAGSAPAPAPEPANDEPAAPVAARAGARRRRAGA